MIDNKFDLIKHSAVIHISSTLSLVERKITNALLKNAYNDLQNKPVHHINISQLSSLIGWEKGNADNEIKEALKKLVETKVELNILGKDKKSEWGITTLLSEAKMKDGICSYGYSSMLRELLYNPNIYARLDLQVQRNFRSKYALALWEFLTDILGAAKKQEIESDWIMVNDIRKLLDATDTYYDQFFQFNQKIIKTAVSEINRESDLLVSVNYLKESRKVIALSFKIQQKNLLPSLEIRDEEIPSNHACDISTNNAANDTQEQLLERLNTVFKVPTRTARRLLDTYGYETIENDLMAVTKSMKNGKIKNLAAFTIKAIEEHYGEKTTIKKEENIMTVPLHQNHEESIAHEGWKSVRKSLLALYGDGIFNSWFAQLDFVKIENNTVYLMVKTAFMKGWIEQNYMNVLLKSWRREDMSIETICLVLSPSSVATQKI